MILHNTPVEDHTDDLGLWVKREDLCCPPPGPPFSKTRGVFSHIAGRPERLIGALDTYHSQAGHAVAHACRELGRDCIVFYPEYKAEPGPRQSQRMARELGAALRPIPAGRSAVLYHAARRALAQEGATRGADAYMMPNALKLRETVDETAAEVERGRGQLPLEIPWLIAVSSGTIAAGVIRGAKSLRASGPFLLHMGYDRSVAELEHYVRGLAADAAADLRFINEHWAYRDAAEPLGLPFPANPYYDLKAVRWWIEHGRAEWGAALLWLIG